MNVSLPKFIICALFLKFVCPLFYTNVVLYDSSHFLNRNPSNCHSMAHYVLVVSIYYTFLYSIATEFHSKMWLNSKRQLYISVLINGIMSHNKPND